MSTTHAPTPLIGERPEDASIRDFALQSRIDEVDRNIDRTAHHLINMRGLRDRSSPDGFATDEQIIDDLVSRVYGTKHNGNQVYERSGRAKTAPEGATETLTELVNSRVTAIQREAALARAAAKAAPSKPAGRLVRGFARLRRAGRN